MDVDEDIDISFQDTIDWATLVSANKIDRTKGLPIFYIVMGVFVALIILVLIVYIMSPTKKKKSALELMQNSNYEVAEEGDEGGEYEIIEEIIEE